MKRICNTLLFLFTSQIVLSQSSQSFNSNGTFTVPSGVTTITIEVVGAGGNGAGNGGGGGGGGGYAKGIFAVTPGTVLTVNIGNSGGGSSGGSTSVTGLISATGGGNATTVSNPNIGGGGAGGAGSNGSIVNRTGGNGGGGYWTYFGGGGGGAGGPGSNGSNGGNTIAYNGSNCLTPGGSGGTGGGMPGGNGGKGAGFVDSQCNNADPAGLGQVYGGGGGGGNGNSSPAQVGAGGYCKIEFGCTAPSAPVNAGSTMTLCSGNSATLSASGSGTITWYSGPSGGSPIATGSVFVTPVLTTTTNFYASSQTCITSAQRSAFTVSVFPLPVISISASPGPYCVNQPLTLTASGGQNYIWSTASTGSILTVIPTGTAVFCPTAVATGTNGCEAYATLTINIDPQPTLSIVPVTTLCAGQVITFTATGASTYSWSNGPQGSSFPLAVFSTTVLTVTGTNSAGCSNTAAITQTVLQNPTVAISGNTQLCSGQSIQLTASGANTYTWAGNGAGTVITVTPSSSTVYTLTGTNTQGCSAVTSKSVTVNPCTRITELPEKDHFVVYPNPSTGAFTIKASQDVNLHLYSFSGQILQVVNLDKKNDWTQRLETLSRGIYFLTDDKGKHFQKLIVQ